MRILWVKTAGLAPQDTGGKIRSYNILQELSRRHSVTLFTFYGAHDNDVNPQLADVFDRVVCLPLSLPEPKSAAEMRDYVLRLPTLEPYNISKYCRPIVRQSLMEVLRSGAYDVIVCDFIFAAGVIPWDWPCPKVLFSHNVEAMIWKRHYDVASSPLWKAVSWREWQTMQRAERKYLSKCDHVFTVSESDRDAFVHFLNPGKITVLPTGVDSEYFSPQPVPEAPDSLVFVGSMDWLPNEDAVCYFVQDVLPLIRRHIPSVSLTVVGRLPSSRLRALASQDRGIHITGRVEDVRSFVARSSVSIIPLRIGGGTRIKIYEAMAMGKPIVCTPLGAEGLPVTDGTNIMLAGTSADFATAVVSLLHDARRRAELGNAARRFVSRNVSWGVVSDLFERTLADACNRQDPTHVPHRVKALS